MKLATLRNDNGKWRVMDPREGKGVTTCKTYEEANQALEAANEEIVADMLAAQTATMSAGTRIELVSVDGSPVMGIPTRAARKDVVVYTQKPGKTNKLTEPRDQTEYDEAQITGYVLLSLKPDGKGVRSEWGQPSDIGRPVPLTPAGIAALAAIFGGSKVAE